MVKILFVCHGNICRSPMAEFVMKKLVNDAGYADDIEISSAAVSAEETGNDIYPPAQRKLREKAIPFTHRAARQFTRSDYTRYDYIVCMDRSNLRLLRYIVGEDAEKKVSLLMQWADKERDVADPWYTGNFEAAYRDVDEGCKAMLQRVISSTSICDSTE